MNKSLEANIALWAAAGAAFSGFAPSASAIVYDRNAAVACANANWNKVVSDGFFLINGNTANYYGAGASVPVNVTCEASGVGDDCATLFPVACWQVRHDGNYGDWSAYSPATAFSIAAVPEPRLHVDGLKQLAAAGRRRRRTAGP